MHRSGFRSLVRGVSNIASRVYPTCAHLIKAVRRIAERDGYQVYKEELDRVCEELLQYDEIRHFMTYGFLSLTMDREYKHQFEFLRYQRDGEGKFTLLSGKTTIERLRQAADDIGQYVSHVIRVFERISARRS